VPADEARAYPIVFLDGQAGAFRKVEAHGRVARALAPYFELARKAPGQQCSAGVKFWVPAVVDQDDPSVAHSIALATLTNPYWLDGDAMKFVGHDMMPLYRAQSTSRARCGVFGSVRRNDVF